MKNCAIVPLLLVCLFCTTASAQSADRPIQSAEAAPPEKSEIADPQGTPSPSQEELAEEARARDAFRRGDRLYFEGDYAGAIAAFEQAYAWSGRIEMLFNLANAHERMGNYSEASVALRGYIPHSPQADRPALERRLERLEELKAEEQEKRERVSTPSVAPAAESRGAPHRPFPIDSTLGVGLLTLGGASLATGVGYAISALLVRKELNDECAEVDGSRLCPSTAETLIQQEKTRSIVADVAFIGGALLTTAGIYFVIRSTRHGKVRTGLVPGRVVVEGSF